MKKRNLKHDSSGQVIIITALLVASLLLSTAIYVFETEKDVPTAGAEVNVLPAYQQSTLSTLISALANVTNGGDSSVLTADLNELNAAITNDSYQAMLQMTYTPLDVAPYQNGLWISWGEDGQGVSSAYVNFVFDSSSSSTSSNWEYDINVTTAANLSGTYQLNGNITQVNLTVNMFNEGTPALAQNITFYFENAAGGWIQVNLPIITDFGNGTYSVSFTMATDQSSDPLLVSMLCQDQRGIVVGANATCSSAGE